MDPLIPLPATWTRALKEWHGICQALGDGRQCLLLRKGGVADDVGFGVEHSMFWLYPTFVHEQEQGLRVPPDLPSLPTEAMTVTIDLFAKVESARRLERWESVEALRPFHVWTDETIRKRFAYRSPGLWAILVRVYRRPEPEVVPVTPLQMGCKSWLTLERSIGTDGLTPTLNDDAFARLAGEVASICS